jgi:hypothetical protein
MYASPVSLLRLLPPRRMVNLGKFASAERDARQSCSCGAGTPGGDSLADFGCSERGLRLRASDAASAGHPPPKRRDTYWPSNYTYVNFFI